MCACVHAWVQVCVCACMHDCMCSCTYMFVCVRAHVHIHRSTHEHISIDHLLLVCVCVSTWIICLLAVTSSDVCAIDLVCSRYVLSSVLSPHIPRGGIVTM